jgi:hypothetical protein
MLCHWPVRGTSRSAPSRPPGAMASPGLMVSDFATANLSRGGRSRHANFSPPVTRIEWNARAPGRGPGPATLPSGSGSFVPTWLGPRAEVRAMAPRPLSSQPLPARLSNQLLLSQPTCRDPSISGPPPSHPGCNAVDSQTCSWETETLGLLARDAGSTG